MSELIKKKEGKMDELNWLIDGGKIIGFPAVIFVMWFLEHKTKTKQFNDLIDNQQTREETIFSQMSNIVTQYAEQSRQNFELLKNMVEQNIYQTGILQEIKSKIDNNELCPYVKNFLKGKNNG